MIEFLKSLHNIIFPHICVCCGLALEKGDLHLCHVCLNRRFDPPEEFPEILPEGIESRIALWQFDKGGYLQHLLHCLKYERIAGIGVELGVQLGFKLRDRVTSDHPILIPVPLHSKKERMRGYNQARLIAMGISERTGWEVIPEKSLIRNRFTQTQTGLTLEQRNKNLSGSFELKDIKDLRDRYPIIVDDVYTTGATTFELFKIFKINGFNKAAIATIAQA
jgi:ComF family protein